MKPKLPNVSILGDCDISTHSFQSGFKDKLNAFVGQKQSLGFPFEGSITLLRKFDKMCYEHFPVQSLLTKEICFAFAVKRPTESGNSFRNRISPIREFAKFLITRGEEAYVIPTNLVKKSPRHMPYIYSKDDIVAIWKECDNLEPIAHMPARHITIPAIVRTLYCCGLRPIEATRLTLDDVDLTQGKLYIQESKSRKDRIVMMPDDLAAYLKIYDDKTKSIFPNRKWFFVDWSGDFCKTRWINAVFLPMRRKLGLVGIGGKMPRLYDFRHTFATHRLYMWMRDGVDLEAMLPYLSAYMGHAQLSDTYYYIHLIPEQYKIIAGFDFSRYEELLPDIEDCEGGELS